MALEQPLVALAAIDVRRARGVDETGAERQDAAVRRQGEGPGEDLVSGGAGRRHRAARRPQTRARALEQVHGAAGVAHRHDLAVLGQGEGHAEFRVLQGRVCLEPAHGLLEAALEPKRVRRRALAAIAQRHAVARLQGDG
jgi:hypothetical protein